MNKPTGPSIKLESQSQCLAIIAVTAIVALILAYLFIPGALAVKSSDAKQAATLNAQTAGLNASVVHGKVVAANPAQWNARVASLSSEFPQTPSDQTLTSSILSAASQAGINSPSESRKEPAPVSGSLQGIALTISGLSPATGPASAAPLTAYITALQNQARLISVSGMTFNFTAGTVAATGTAFLDSTPPPVVSK